MAESAPVGPMAPAGVGGGASTRAGGVARGGTVGAAPEDGLVLALAGPADMGVAGACALATVAEKTASRVNVAIETSRASLAAGSPVSASVRAGRLQDVVTHCSLLSLGQHARALFKPLARRGDTFGNRSMSRHISRHASR